jgi:hypothetical protein
MYYIYMGLGCGQFSLQETPAIFCHAGLEDDLQAAPFTVRSTPDVRNTNGMEQKRVT